MEEAFRRAQLYIDALKGCSVLAPASTIKSYASELDKELEIIKAEVQKLKQSQIPHGSFGKAKRKELNWWQKPKPIPPPEVSYDQQAEKK